MSDSNDSPDNGANDNPTDDNGTPPEAELTPEQLKKELERVRKEAAGYRTKLRSTEEKLAAAKTPEEFEAARTELANENAKLARELLVERVGRDLPDDLRALLTGNTEDELKAHADVLRKYVPATGQTPPPPRNLGGGLDAGKGGDKFDPVAIATAARLGRL